MEVKIISFGYHYGIPEACDVIFDARGIRNPHNSKQLRKLTGLDAAVQEDVFSTPGANAMVYNIAEAVEEARKEGEQKITIGVGCSFGRHRSVAIAERVNNFLWIMKLQAEIAHRDIEK